ncbi:MAG: hypothetical protein ACI81V_001163 [Lentimonas sp.]|jgi:hypothetical protein
MGCGLNAVLSRGIGVFGIRQISRRSVLVVFGSRWRRGEFFEFIIGCKYPAEWAITLVLTFTKLYNKSI